MKKDTVKEYLTGIANLSILRNFFMIGFFVMAIFAAGQYIVIASLAKEIKTVKPMPIFIDRMDGSARAVPFEMIDAEGEERHQTEIYDFISNFLKNLYTFNKYTIKSNLDASISLCSPEAESSVSELVLNERPKYMNMDVQGLCEVFSIEILNHLPDLKCRAVINKKVLSTANGSTISEKRYGVVMRIKTVLREQGNAHGLKVVEYWENLISDEKNRGQE